MEPIQNKIMERIKANVIQIFLFLIFSHFQESIQILPCLQRKHHMNPLFYYK
jgi:hypothetical protein